MNIHKKPSIHFKVEHNGEGYKYSLVNSMTHEKLAELYDDVLASKVACLIEKELQKPTEVEIQEYIETLKRFDWDFGKSDWNAVYRAGRNRLNLIIRVADKIDKDRKIWNEYAPKEWRK